jgi:uncharacterized membrane protein YdbT with pleckstrin-like domain
MSTTPAPEETVVWRGSPSQWTNFGAYLFSLVVAGFIVAACFLTAAGSPVLLGLILPLGFILIRWLETRSHVYEITTERIRTSTGIFSRRTAEIELYRVRDYTVVEPFWLRLIGRGNLIIESADRSSPLIVIHAVPGVAALKDQVRNNTERMRQRRGVRDLEINPQ